MVGHPESSVCEPPAQSDNFHVRTVITNVVAYLLEATQGRKVGNRVGKDDPPEQSHSGGYSGHVLLRHASIQKLRWKLLCQRLYDAKAKIAYDQSDARINRRAL
jgi:hypothetical protein